MRALLVLWLAVPLFSASAYAQTFGASTRGADFGTASTLTWTGPTVSGSNTVGVVTVGLAGISDAVWPTVTWGGVSMTRLTGASLNLSAALVSVYCLAAPASAASIVLDYGADSWSSAFADAQYFTSGNQTTPCAGAVTNGPSGSTGSATFTGTGTSGGVVVDSIMQTGVVETIAVAGGGANTRTQFGSSGGGGSMSWASSYNGTSAAMSWSGLSAGLTEVWGAVKVQPLALPIVKRRVIQ